MTLAGGPLTVNGPKGLFASPRRGIFPMLYTPSAVY